MIKPLSVSRVRKPVGILLFLTLLPTLVACPAPLPSSGPAGYTGETLFRGIFFAEGAVSEKIPELQRAKIAFGLGDLNAKQRAAVQNLEDSLISRFKKVDPAYFVGFQREIQSGDQLRVQGKLRQAGLMMSAILYSRNPGLAQILDTARNQRFREQASKSPKLRQVTSSIADEKYTTEILRTLNQELIIDRNIYVDRFVENRVIRDFAINRNIDVFNFLNIDRNLANAFDRIQVNRAVDNEFNPFGDVTVEIDVAIYAVVAVAVFVAAVLVVAVMPNNIFNDNAGLWNEQLVNSISTNLRVGAP